METESWSLIAGLEGVGEKQEVTASGYGVSF